MPSEGPALTSWGTRHVLAMSGFTDAWLETLRAISPSIELELCDMFSPSEAITDEQWARAEVLFTFRAFPRPEQAPRLRWIQLNSAGADVALSQPICRRPDVQVTTVSGIHAIPIAEHVFT